MPENSHASNNDTKTHSMSLEGKTVISIPPSDLRAKFKKLSPFMSEEGSRHYLCGIYCQYADGQLTMCATNGHILCEIVMSATVAEEGEFALILPAEAVKALIKVMPKTKECPYILIKVTEDCKEIEFETLDFSYRTRVIDGTFPDYVNLIPAGHVKMREGMRASYLQTALAALGDTPVDISVDDEANAAMVPHLLTSHEAEGIRCVIMPMRVDNGSDLSSPDDKPADSPEADAEGEVLYRAAVSIVIRDQKAQTGYIMRKINVGFTRADKIIARMEREGVISTVDHTGKRKVLKKEHTT